MTRGEAQQDRWMPVFVVQTKLRTLRSEGPDDDAACDRSPEPDEIWQRVGTAFLEANGTWHIGITVLPLNGRFVMPSEPGEAPEDSHVHSGVR
jgi:hypothetical protein